jgi:hypothetical protein
MTPAEHTSASAEKRPLAPDPSTLDPRAARAWTEPMAVVPLGSGRYAVESASDSRYVVDLSAGDCECPDHRFRAERCKHLRRVSIQISRGELPPPGRRRGDCRACGRTAFLPESGPPLCEECAFDPGDLARDRETGDLVVVVATTDERADERTIPDTGVTVADYETNDGYPADDPVVEAVYPFSGASDAPPEGRRRYAFPHSRLAPTGASAPRDRA